jgi:hypothetical protein
MQRCLDIGNLQITPRVNRIETYESFDIALAVQLGSVIVKYLKDTRYLSARTIFFNNVNGCFELRCSTMAVDRSVQTRRWLMPLNLGLRVCVQM